MVRRALISVSNKRGVVEFAKSLNDLSFEIVSTGGTAEVLRENGIDVIPISEVTGFPEILDGRVKTLHPKVFGGILADKGQVSHMNQLQLYGIKPIDMVVVNLYPFEETAKRTKDEKELIEQIDIGGVALLRAAAKNYRNVIVVCDPDDYDMVLYYMREKGDVPLKERKGLALKVFRRTADYDKAILKVLTEVFSVSDETL